jgi:hypothetical protein
MPWRSTLPQQQHTSGAGVVCVRACTAAVRCKCVCVPSLSPPEPGCFGWAPACVWVGCVRDAGPRSRCRGLEAQLRSAARWQRRQGCRTCWARRCLRHDSSCACGSQAGRSCCRPQQPRAWAAPRRAASSST